MGRPKKKPPELASEESAQFARKPGCPFDDLRKEHFCQARAKGDSVERASEAAGIAKGTGENWAHRPSIVGRVSELRRGATRFVTFSKAWVLNEVHTLVGEARAELHFKTALAGLEFIYKAISADKDLAAETASALPAEITNEQLRKQLQERLRGARPALPEPEPNELEELEAEGEEVPA